MTGKRHCLVCNGHLIPGIPYKSIYEERVSDEKLQNDECVASGSSDVDFSRASEEISRPLQIQLKGRLESVLLLSLTRTLCHSSYICVQCERKLSEVERYYKVVSAFRGTFLATAHAHGIKDTDIAGQLTSRGFSEEFLQQMPGCTTSSSPWQELLSPRLLDTAINKSSNCSNTLKNKNKEQIELASKWTTIQKPVAQQQRGRLRKSSHPQKVESSIPTEIKYAIEMWQDGTEVSPEEAVYDGTTDEDDNYVGLDGAEDTTSLASRPERDVDVDGPYHNQLQEHVGGAESLCNTSVGIQDSLSPLTVPIHTKEQQQPETSDSWEQNFQNYGRLISAIHPSNDTGAGEPFTKDKNVSPCDSEKPNKCNVCGKSFKFGRTLKSHAMSHWSQRNHVCSTCNRGFHTKAYLIQHIKKVHSGSKTSKRQRALKKVSDRKQMSDRKQKCTVCGEQFWQKRELTAHLLEHAEEQNNGNSVVEKFMPKDSLVLGDKPKGMEEGSMKYSGDEAPEKPVDEGLPTSKFPQNMPENDEENDNFNNCDEEVMSELPEHSSESEAKDYNDIKVTMGVPEPGLGHTEREHNECVDTKAYRDNMEEWRDKCATCGKGFNTKDELHLHLRTHNTERVYVCSLCDKIFLQRDYLTRHMSYHQLKHSKQLSLKHRKESQCSESHLCTICGESVPNLITHMRKHAKESRHPCTVCDKEYQTVRGLKMHMMQHTQKWPFTCEVCGKGCSTKTHVKDHMRIHTGDRPHNCNACGKTFIRKAMLDAHKFEHTGGWPHVCSECGKGFAIERSFRQHMLLHTGEFPYACHQCDKGFKTKTQLEVHLLAHSGKRKHECSICGKYFLTKGVLVRHMKIHCILQIHECSMCSKSFSNVDYLKKHVTSIHTATRKHKCTQCEKLFKSKVGLTNHMVQHCADLAHICSMCGKGYAVQHSLTVHMMGHTGERPHLCSTCGKGFKTAQVLRTHILTHSIERTHACNICNKSFKSRDYLIKHMLSHSDERPYKCTVCEKQFKMNASLTVHMAIHTGEQSAHARPCMHCGKLIKGSMTRHVAIHTGKWPVKCSLCGKGAQSIWHIQKHIQTMHPTEECRAVTVVKN